jgi:hypothetical protein
MAEAAEQKDEKQQEVTEENQEQEQQQERQSGETDGSIEKVARKMGWKPKDEYEKQNGDPDKWVDAQSYLERSPVFYDKNRKLTRRIRELEGTVASLTDHYRKVEQNAYTRAMEDLKRAKVQALEEGNHAKVVEIDDQIAKIKPTPQQNQGPRGPDPAFRDWVDRNPWYIEDEEMAEKADAIGTRYAGLHPEAEPEEVFEYAEKRIKTLYADRFKNPNRERASPVEGARSNKAMSRKVQWRDLPEHFQKAGEKFARQGIMTKEQYIDDLVKIGEIKP